MNSKLVTRGIAATVLAGGLYTATAPMRYNQGNDEIERVLRISGDAQDIEMAFDALSSQEKSDLLRRLKPDIEADSQFCFELLSGAADRLTPQASQVIVRKAYACMPPDQRPGQLMGMYASLEREGQRDVLKYALATEASLAYESVSNSWLGRQMQSVFGHESKKGGIR